MKFRTPYDLGEKPEGLHCETPSQTQQQFKDECDLHTILRAHGLGQYASVQVNQQTPLYADVSDVPDFHESQNHVARATEYFMSMPSGVRSQFNNNLQEFLSALNNPANREKLQELGVLKQPTPEPEAVPNQVASPVGEAGSQSVSVPSEQTVQKASEGGVTS